MWGSDCRNGRFRAMMRKSARLMAANKQMVSDMPGWLERTNIGPSAGMFSWPKTRTSCTNFLSSCRAADGRSFLPTTLSNSTIWRANFSAGEWKVKRAALARSGMFSQPKELTRSSRLISVKREIGSGMIDYITPALTKAISQRSRRVHTCASPACPRPAVQGAGRVFWKVFLVFSVSPW